MQLHYLTSHAGYLAVLSAQQITASSFWEASTPPCQRVTYTSQYCMHISLQAGGVGEAALVLPTGEACMVAATVRATAAFQACPCT